MRFFLLRFLSADDFSTGNSAPTVIFEGSSGEGAISGSEFLRVGAFRRDRFTVFLAVFSTIGKMKNIFTLGGLFSMSRVNKTSQTLMALKGNSGCTLNATINHPLN